MASVFKRTGNNGKWYIRYRDPQGRDVRQSTEAKTKRKAMTELARVLSSLEDGSYQEKKRQNEVGFFEIVDDFLEYGRSHKRSWDKDERSIHKLRAFFGNVLVSQIRRHHIEQYIAERRKDSPRTGKQGKPATINRELACLRTIFRRAVDSGKLASSPMRSFKLLPEDNVRDRVLTEDEYQRFVECAPEHLKPVIIMAWETGMRKGEILNLNWSQVDLKKGLIRLEASGTKTGKGRIVPISPWLHEILKPMQKDLGPVFVYKGKPLRDIRTGFHKACRDAGIQNFWFHDLRHCFVTNSRRKGVPDRIIMAITGHTTMECFKRYDSISVDDLKRAVGG
jgi:integrase